MTTTNSFTQDLSSVMTFNVRYATAKDGINQWENRKKDVLNLLKNYSPDIVGFQEMLKSQLEFIDENLNKYNHVGVAREDGKSEGEFSPIFFNTKKYKIIENGTFWLSKTPDVPSIGWDAAHKRVCTYVKLVNLKKNNFLWVFNTHFDHLGKEARINSSKLLISKIEKLLDHDKEKIILMGDFNSLPNSEPIKIIMNKLEDGMMNSKNKFKGELSTFNGFEVNKKNDGKRIDYIFSKNLNINSYNHLYDKRQNSLYVSDHFPVLISFYK